MIFLFSEVRNYIPSDLNFFAIVVFFARRTKVRLSLENNDSLLKNLAEDKTESNKHRFDLMSKL